MESAKKNIMKKLVILSVLSTMIVAGCAPVTKLTNTATHKRVNVLEPVVAVFADLDVAPAKISFFYIPSKTVVNAGTDNVIDSAVHEALLANGNADVLVGLEKQIKYTPEGQIESITVTGYPAKYVNFRSPGDDYLREVSKASEVKGKEGNSLLGKLKIGK